MSAILKLGFKKGKTITFSRRKLSKLYKKDIILHVKFTFSLKQGETRIISGPIWVPLRYYKRCHDATRSVFKKKKKKRKKKQGPGGWWEVALGMVPHGEMGWSRKS